LRAIFAKFDQKSIECIKTIKKTIGNASQRRPKLDLR